MYMKAILYVSILCLLASCSVDNDFPYDNAVTAGNVKLIKLRADHSTLLPDGKATMKFYAEAYNILEFPNYTPEYVDGIPVYNQSVVRDTSLIPTDQLPDGLFRLLDENGKEYPSFCYSTTNTELKSIRFHLEAGELSSQELEIKIRPLPTKEYTEIKIPVVFHVLNLAKKAGVAPITITSETVYKNIKRLNDVFNGVVTTDPNGGNAKISFLPAEYDNRGLEMATPGIHNIEIPATEVLESDEDYEAYVLAKKTNLIYNYKNFLNIWLINNPNGSSTIVRSPNVIDSKEHLIAGLPAKELPEAYPENATDVGFFISMSYFLNPMQSSDYYEISTTMAQYLGLLTSQVMESAGMSNMVNGDTDYCADTQYWWNDNGSVFKNNAKDDITNATLYFTSYHVMDRYSYKNSLTCDQIDRIHKVLEHCPARWMYKSKFAFTGNKEDMIE